MSSVKHPDSPNKTRWKVSRRGFMRDIGVGGGALGTTALQKVQAEPGPASAKVVGPGPVPITLMVNRTAHKIEVEPRTTLLDALRDKLGLTGAKSSCDRGTCGSCTVLMSGKAVYACSILAVDAAGKDIQTIESIGAGDPLVRSMVKNDGTQCGFCAPGMILASKAFLSRNSNPDEKQLVAALSGNLCRCGAYVPIRKSVLEAARAGKGGRNA